MTETLTERMRHAAAHVEVYDQEWEAQQLRDGAAEIERLRQELHEVASWAEESLVRARDHYTGGCDCEPCPECGKTPRECSDTDCAQTCQCSTCDHCHFEATLERMRMALMGPNVEVTGPEAILSPKGPCGLPG